LSESPPSRYDATKYRRRLILEEAMLREVTIVDVADVPLIEQSIGREGQILAKTFPLDTGVTGAKMDFTWLVHGKGYGTPRHRHTFDQFRITFEGVRQSDDGDMGPGECGYFPEGVAYGPQHQDERESGLILQFEGPSGIPYLTHEELDAARQRLIAEGGTFAKGVYTKILPDGRKINRDSHAACFEAITGKKMEFPEPRYERPILIKPQTFKWVPDRKLAGVEHKHLGTFGERRSGMRLTKLSPGAKIPAHIQEDAEILYLTEGSITYDGKTWKGGKTETEGTYIYIPPNCNVKEIATETGGQFFVISLPMLADIEAEMKAGRSRAA
jgi:quercetin dioxygenase-like cupin family protein